MSIHPEIISDTCREQLAEYNYRQVIISHSNIINQLRQVQAFTPAKSSPAVILGILPFYHSTCDSYHHGADTGLD